MTDESKFVLVEDVLRIPEANSWAEDVDDNTKEQGSVKHWDLTTEDEGQGMSLAEIMAEEQKKAEQAAKERARKPKPAPAPTSHYSSQSRGVDRPLREQREAQPRGELPTEPPYTAFVGNLPFSVTEEEMKGLFEGVSKVRLMKDQATGKGKGFCYIVFDTLDDLKRALEKNGQSYSDRSLNIDVAKPQQKSTWSSSGGFERREQREREPNKWGPSSSGSAFGDRKTFDRDGNKPASGSTFGDRKPFGERAFDKNRTPAPSGPSGTSGSARPKSSSEDPFGSANVDKKRQDELANERLKREIEREQERAKEKEAREKKRDDDKRRHEDEKKKETPQLNWRNQKTGNAPVSPRAFNNKEREFNSNRSPRSDDGFKSGVKTKTPYEATGTGSAVRASEAVANAKQARPPKPEPAKHTEESNAKKNIYDFLEEQDA